MSNMKSEASRENSVFEDPESPDVNTGKKLPPKDVDESLGDAIDETMDEETEIPENDPARERSR
ncbi:hypothetical protein GTW51_13340 [Aurantimonas aggregata]|uniref:Uncharacterized protein n=1 Tax=Aurantimonas aggregata TaxID=2047720 RepID=A0A6L9MIN5_9HYPH|nr:hypothetical protein [Aurantimonas aggregata]NDV87685.1 hypothetical protein [Aurantimonas aggregata]